MGRYYGYGVRQELDNLLFIDAARLKQWDFLRTFCNGTITWTNSTLGTQNNVGAYIRINDDESYLQLTYTQTVRDKDEKTKLDYKIELLSTPCNFGGKRWWFLCPIVKNNLQCSRRVRKLYLSGKYFGCRSCHELCYAQQKENHHYSMAPIFKVITNGQKADELRKQIKVPIYNGRLTKKMRRFMELRRQAHGSAKAWEQIHSLMKE